MTSALRRPETITRQHRITACPPANGAPPLLDHLRTVAREARCKSHMDLSGACLSLSSNRENAENVAADVLMRGLSQALGRRPVLLRAGEPERSFDESWLMMLVRCLKEGDTPSAAFLLHSRIPGHKHRNIVHLLRSAVAHFDRD